jgi:hypothetical protein
MALCLPKTPFSLQQLMLRPRLIRFGSMMSVLLPLLRTLQSWARSRAALQLEVLALRHQLHVLQRSRPRRLRLAKTDRWLWVVLSRLGTEWRTALVIVQPETVIALAPTRLSNVVDLEEPPSHRATDRAHRHPDADPYDGASEPSLGRAADSWRTAEAWDRRLSDNRCEIHAALVSVCLAKIASDNNC